MSRAVTVEEVDDTDVPNSTKPVQPAQVIEIDDSDDEGGTAATQTGTANHKSASQPSSAPAASTSSGAPSGVNGTSKVPPFKSSAPKVSSKLRYSFQVDGEGSHSETETTTGRATGKPDTRGLDLLSSAAVPGAPKLAPAGLPFQTATSSSFGAAPSTHSMTFAPAAQPSASTSLFAPPPLPAAPSPKTPQDVMDAVKAMTASDLVVYRFELPPSLPSAGAGVLKAREDARAAPASSLPTFDINVSRAEKPFKMNPTPPLAGSWKCSLCGLDNPNSAKEQCLVCDEPRPGAVKAAPQGGFNWAAAGMKKPERTTGWVCSTCMVANAASDKKCAACETER